MKKQCFFCKNTKKIKKYFCDEHRIFYGNEKTLLEYMKLHKNFQFYKENEQFMDYMEIDEIVKIMYCENIHTISKYYKNNIILLCLHNNKNSKILNLNNFSENSINYKEIKYNNIPIILLNNSIILDMALDNFNIEIEENIKNFILSLNKYDFITDLVYKYSLIDHEIINFPKNNTVVHPDAIYFFRRNIYLLENWNVNTPIENEYINFGKFSSIKVNILQILLTRLEYSFLKTGNIFLTYYFNCFVKVINDLYFLM